MIDDKFPDRYSPAEESAVSPGIAHHARRVLRLRISCRKHSSKYGISATHGRILRISKPSAILFAATKRSTMSRAKDRKVRALTPHRRSAPTLPTHLRSRPLPMTKWRWCATSSTLFPRSKRSCIQLRDFEGKPYKDIARSLNMTEEQVKINIFRGRKTIKERFEQMNNYRA